MISPQLAIFGFTLGVCIGAVLLGCGALLVNWRLDRIMKGIK